MKALRTIFVGLSLLLGAGVLSLSAADPASDAAPAPDAAPSVPAPSPAAAPAVGDPASSTPFRFISPFSPNLGIRPQSADAAAPAPTATTAPNPSDTAVTPITPAPTPDNVQPSLAPHLLNFHPPGTAAATVQPPPAAISVPPVAAPTPVLHPPLTPSVALADTGDERVGDYMIHTGDTLSVTMAGEPDFDLKVVVQNSGTIALPYVGEVPVEGKTLQQANGEIVKRLSKFYVNPNISLGVLQYRKKEFIILGQVNNPGVYAFAPEQDSMSLFEAIAKAGGVRQYGDMGNVTVKRVVDGREQIIPVNAREARALSRNQEGLMFQILPGDSIVIALYRNEINLLGEVRRPGIYTLPPLLDSIDLIEAIAMAGGTTDQRDLGMVHVKRLVDGKETTLAIDAKDIGRNKANANFPVYAGDTLIVEVVDNDFIVLGQVNHPGSYQIPPFHDAVDLIEAIAMAGGATRLADTSHITIRRVVKGKPVVIKADAQKLSRSANTDSINVLPGDRIVVSERIF